MVNLKKTVKSCAQVASLLGMPEMRVASILKKYFQRGGLQITLPRGKNNGGGLRGKAVDFLLNRENTNLLKSLNMEEICSLVNMKFGLEVDISELEKFYIKV